MVVDDDDDLRAALKCRFEARADHVLCCESGRAALDALESGVEPDLILLDLSMPGMDGLQFRAAQKRQPRWANIPVIVMSGRAAAQGLDAAAYLPKPVDEATLLETVERVANAPRQPAPNSDLARAEEVQRLVSLGALLGGIAHEINNPLAFVFGSIDILQRQLVSLVHPHQSPEPFSVAMAMRALERAREGAERVAAVVRSASMFASADLEASEVLDIHQVLESAIQVASNEIRHGAHLVRNYREVAQVRSNPARLGQVFLNLLLNAVYAIRDHGGRDHVIRVSTENLDGMVVVTIADSATSLEQISIASTFDPTNPPYSGGPRLRFGLAVSRELVQAMGGSIDVTPEQPRGARFRVSLPMSSRISFPAPPPKPPMRVSADGASVLIVDDEPLLCELLSAMLSDDYAVAAFTSPRAALAALMEREFDVVLCDVMMPELTGMELFDRAVRERPELAARFVFITGGAFTERARLFLKQTGRPVLRKPCERRELLEVVDRIVTHAV
ncbi:MAG TPA: response regulator [Polyangiales bacterium]